jgi:hypothetical protein
MNKMVFYMSPHIDNSGLTIHMPEDIYLKVNNLLEEHYEENHWKSLLKRLLVEMDIVCLIPKKNL